MNTGSLIRRLAMDDGGAFAYMVSWDSRFILCLLALLVYGSYISPKPYVMIPGRAVNHFLSTASESRSIYRAAPVMGNFLRVMGENKKRELG